MKIAFTAKGSQWDSQIDARFGRARVFLIYDEKKNQLLSYDNSASAEEAHGAGPKASQKLFELNPDILITGNGPGSNAAIVLQKAGIDIYTGAGDMTIEAALKAYENGKLKAF